MIEVQADLAETTITINSPPEYAGTYSFDTTDLIEGPVCLVPPRISGSAVVGGELTVVNALWIYDTNKGAVDVIQRWQMDGTDLAADASAPLILDASAEGRQISYFEQSDQADKTVSVRSAAVSVVAAAPPAVLMDSFTTDAPVGLGDYLGESNLAYTSPTGGAVQAKVASGRVYHQTFSIKSIQRGDEVYTDSVVQGAMRFGSHTRNAASVGLALRIQPNGDCYYAVFKNPSINRFEIHMISGGSDSTLVVVNNTIDGFSAVGDLTELRFTAQGNVLTLAFRQPGDSSWNDLLTTQNDSLASGKVGIVVGGPNTLGVASELDNFGGGVL